MDSSPSILIIANPISGKRRRGRRTAEGVCAALQRRGLSVQVRYTHSAGDAERIAEEAVAGDGHVPECLVPCGGDGTIQQVAHVLAGVRARLGDRCPAMALAPSGRCNDFARALGVSTDAETIAGIIAAGNTRSIDLGKVNDRYFCTVATVGIDAEISRYVDEMRIPLAGTIAYLYGAIPVLLRYKPRTLRIEGDFGCIEEPVFLASSANTFSYGGAVPIAPGADPTDGLLDLCVIEHTSIWRAFCLIPTLLRGRHTSRREVSFVQTKRVSIEAPEPLELWADGEHIATTPAIIEIAPAAINIRLP